MIRVKFTPKGVFLSRVTGELNENAMELFIDVYEDPKDLQTLIEELQKAKGSLEEHQARLAEEGNNLWESA